MTTAASLFVASWTRSGHGAVFTINPDGTDERQITDPPTGFVDRNPDVSPDGRRITFEREGDHHDEIFVVNVDGTRPHQLTRNAPGEVCNSGGTCSGSPAWSRMAGKSPSAEPPASFKTI